LALFLVWGIASPCPKKSISIFGGSVPRNPLLNKVWVLILFVFVMFSLFPYRKKERKSKKKSKKKV